MADKINEKNKAENSTEVSLKTPSDVHLWWHLGKFSEVLADNQSNNINKISNEIGKKLETFIASLIAHKAKSSTGVATISINSNKTKPMGAATTSVNPKSVSRTNASVEDDGDNSSSSHDCQEEDTDTRKGKRKRVTDLKVNKK